VKTRPICGPGRSKTFGPVYAQSAAHDQVLTQLDGQDHRSDDTGTDAQQVWRAVVAAIPDRVPATRLR